MDNKLRYYEELIIFFNKGLLSTKTSFYFGFEKIYYHLLKLKIPTDEQLDNLKNRLELIITISFSEKEMEKILQEYIKNPEKYRETLGEGFEWVRTYYDAKPFLDKNIKYFNNFDYKTRNILYEIDPLIKV